MVQFGADTEQEAKDRTGREGLHLARLLAQQLTGDGEAGGR